MNNLWMMVGLPRSGKSTHSKGLGFPVVSADAIRQAMGVYPFVPAAEPWVWQVARNMVEALFNAGHQDVILDSCSQTKARRNEWKSKKWTRQFIEVATPSEICKQRAHDTGQCYLLPIIDKMAAEFEPITEEEAD